MTHKFVIQATLPGLNEYIEAERCHRQKAAKMKRDTEDLIGYCIRAQLPRVRIQKPVVLRYLWVEENKRRDKDNIAFAHKFVQDALVKNGILSGDGWKYIDHFVDTFAVDSQHPRVEIEIEELDIPR